MEKTKIIVIERGNYDGVLAIKNALVETHEVIIVSDPDGLFEQSYKGPIPIAPPTIFEEYESFGSLKNRHRPKGHQRPYKFHRSPMTHNSSLK